jgi:hypothetical protein
MTKVLIILTCQGNNYYNIIFSTVLTKATGIKKKNWRACLCALKECRHLRYKEPTPNSQNLDYSFISEALQWQQESKQITSRILGMETELPHSIGDPVCDHDDDFSAGLHPSQRVGQHQASQRVRVIGGQSHPRLILNNSWKWKRKLKWIIRYILTVRNKCFKT